MTPEQKARHFDDIIYSDCFDELLVYRLKVVLKHSMEDLEYWSKEEGLSDFLSQDFADTVRLCRSVIFVLENFSAEDFTEEMVQTNKYCLKLEEAF